MVCSLSTLMPEWYSILWMYHILLILLLLFCFLLSFCYCRHQYHEHLHCFLFMGILFSLKYNLTNKNYWPNKYIFKNLFLSWLLCVEITDLFHLNSDCFLNSCFFSPVCIDYVRFLLFLFWRCHRVCRILVPQPGIEPRPWQWKRWIIPTRPPGNSLNFSFIFYPWLWIDLFHPSLFCLFGHSYFVISLFLRSSLTFQLNNC